MNFFLAMFFLAMAALVLLGEVFKRYWLSEVAALCSGIFGIVLLLWFAVALLWWAVGGVVRWAWGV